MMNFSVKYHFSHALIRCLGKEGHLERKWKGQHDRSLQTKAYSLTFPHDNVHTVSQQCPPYTAPLTHPTDPQPVKHIPVCYPTIHTLLATLHLSAWKRVDTDRPSFNLQPCFDSFTNHCLLKHYLNPSQTDCPSLFIISWLLPYFPPNFLPPLPNSGLIVSCQHQWNPEKDIPIW